MGVALRPCDRLAIGAVDAANVRGTPGRPVDIDQHTVEVERATSAEEINDIRTDDIRTMQEVIERGVRLGRFTCDDPFLATAERKGEIVTIVGMARGSRRLCLVPAV